MNPIQQDEAANEKLKGQTRRDRRQILLDSAIKACGEHGFCELGEGYVIVNTKEFIVQERECQGT